MTERDFTAGGRDFKLNKMDAMKQFHVVRRLGPILGDIIPVAQKIKGTITDSAQSEEERFESIAVIAQPILNGLSKLSDEDANKVILGLLSTVEVRQMPAGNWGRVAREDMIMMQDIEFPVLLQVAGRAFAYNLSGFFATAQQTSHGGK